MLSDNQQSEHLFREGNGASLSRSKPQVVAVTGASAGLGRAIIRAFAREVRTLEEVQPGVRDIRPSLAPR